MGLLRRDGRRGYDDDFVAFCTDRGDYLRNTAYLLCGDWHHAEDLAQATLIKLYRAWSRIERHDTLDQYARRVLLRTFLDERRRPWRREVSTVPDSAALDRIVPDEHHIEERLRLYAALMRLTKRRRAALVLRFWADLSVEQVADLMGCSTGTVKSLTSRGLTHLRELLADVLIESTSTGGDRW